MTDEELIARLRNNPTDEEAEMAATRIYNLGLLNDLAEANLEAEELTNWLKLKEAEARVERLEQERDAASIERDFFQSEVKLRNRIPATSDPVADLQRRVEALEAALNKAILWTDEEYDVGPWRDFALSALKGDSNE